MKFIKGFTVGLLAGFAAGSALSEQQRRQLVARVRRQSEPVRAAVADNVQRVADTATERVTDRVDAVGEAVNDAVDADATVRTG